MEKFGCTANNGNRPTEWERSATDNTGNSGVRRRLIDDMTALDGWENFYVIVGSSAGALIGLQFVVMALIAETPNARPDAQAGAAFSTPSVVHFGVVLLLSAIMSAPWHTLGAVGVVW